MPKMSHQSHSFERGDRHTQTRIQDFLILIGAVSFWAVCYTDPPGGVDPLTSDDTPLISDPIQTPSSRYIIHKVA